MLRHHMGSCWQQVQGSPVSRVRLFFVSVACWVLSRFFSPCPIFSLHHLDDEQLLFEIY